MKIDRHISELLYDHDCVIVPSFGGFLASYQPAQHLAIQHTFYPPSKKIAFNVFLKNNDGLLANHVAQHEKLTYAEALKGIESFRLDAIKLLESGKQIIIEDVGTLFYDKQKNLQFEPAKHINYLEESFGLTAVQSPPVKREEQRKKVERQIRQAVWLRSSVKPEQVKSQGKTRPMWKVFNTVTLSGALLWFAFNIYLITPHTANVSSLNPFSYSSTEKVTPVNPSSSAAATKTPSASTASTSTVSPPAQIQKAADAADKTLPATQPPADNSVESANTAPAKEEVAPASGKTVHATTTTREEKHYFLIAGAFRDPANADKLVASLKQEGFTDAQIINPEESLKKVCYNSFASREEAVAALQQLHSAKKDGWVLVR